MPINIEDSPSTQGKESPSKAPITYERGTHRSPTWKEKVELQDTKQSYRRHRLTLLKLEETQNMEKG